LPDVGLKWICQQQNNQNNSFSFISKGLSVWSGRRGRHNVQIKESFLKAKASI
jgi:hypothetical protein